MLVRVLVVVGLAMGFASGSVRADAPPSTSSSAAAGGTAAAFAVDVDGWLAKLTSADPGAQRSAIAAADAAAPPMLPGIAKRLLDLDKSANRDAMGEVLARAKKVPSGPAAEALEQVGLLGDAANPAWRDLVSILAMSRALARMGTTPAARELIAIFPRFGEALRPSVEHDVKSMGERAVAALIELRRGEAKPFRSWATKVLDALGKTLPGEAVQTADNQVLADVLRAYGKTKDVDAARVIVSFANSDRNQVRDAAREAVSMLGENGIWQLRESYENLLGKKAPEEWGCEKLASELFAAYDRSRLSEVYALMDEGLASYKAGKLDAMATAFDRVLARAPGFERRREMVSGYMDFARSVEKTDRNRAERALRRVARIDPTGARARQAESELVYLEALDLEGRGVVDETAYRRAVELDPNNVEARAAWARVTTGADSRGGAITRYGIGGTLVLAAIAFGLLGFLGRGKEKVDPAPRA